MFAGWQLVVVAVLSFCAGGFLTYREIRSMRRIRRLRSSGPSVQQPLPGRRGRRTPWPFLRRGGKKDASSRHKP